MGITAQQARQIYGWIQVAQIQPRDGYTGVNTSHWFIFDGGGTTRNYDAANGYLEWDMGATNFTASGVGISSMRYCQGIYADIRLGTGDVNDDELMAIFQLCESNDNYNYDLRITNDSASHGLSDVFTLSRVDAGTPTVLATSNATFTNNADQEVKFYRGDNDIVVEFEGAEIMRVTDTTYPNGIMSLSLQNATANALTARINSLKVFTRLNGIG